MCKTRHGIFPTESLIKKYVQRRTRQPLLTTDYMRDFHQVVVYDICQVISWQFISTLIKHLIIQNIAHNLHITTNHIVHVNFLSWFNLETYSILLSVSNQLINLFLRKSQRVAHLHTSMSIILEILDFGTFCFQLLRSIKSNIRLIIIQELLNILLIDITTFTLAIRSMLSTETYTLVKLDTQPLERFQDIFFGSRHETMRICILNTEHQLTSMLASKQIIIQSGTNTANVQCTRWTRGKTHPYFSICHVFL